MRSRKILLILTVVVLATATACGGGSSDLAATITAQSVQIENLTQKGITPSDTPQPLASATAPQTLITAAPVSQRPADDASAISMTKVLLQNNPTDWNADTILALLYRDMGQPDAAKEALQKAIAVAPAYNQTSLQWLSSQLIKPT